MRVAPALFVLVLVSGCVAKPSSPDGLAGEWTLLAIDDADPVQTSKARMVLNEERLSATVGCNGMGGPWRIEENRLIAGPLDGTRKYCTGPVWKQEEALTALLVAAPTIAYDDGELVLRSSRHSARFERINPPQSDS
jgi:heat shock protein HslJ